MRVDAATQFTGLTLPQLNITGDLKCHPLVLQHCQFNPQLMRFYLAGFVNILKECCCQCNEIFIWHKQLAKSGQVQICGLLLCFATIQIQTSSSLLEQVNLTTLLNHYGIMFISWNQKYFCNLGWQKWAKFHFLKSFASFVVLGRPSGNHQFGNAREDCSMNVHPKTNSKPIRSGLSSFFF